MAERERGMRNKAWNRRGEGGVVRLQQFGRVQFCSYHATPLFGPPPLKCQPSLNNDWLIAHHSTFSSLGLFFQMSRTAKQLGILCSSWMFYKGWCSWQLWTKFNKFQENSKWPVSQKFKSCHCRRGISVKEAWRQQNKGKVWRRLKTCNWVKYCGNPDHSSTKVNHANL